MVSWKDEEEFTSREWMTADVNAAIEGAFEGGATYVCVRDAHGPARNIVPEDLDRRADLCRGWGPQAMMVEGVGEGYDTLFLVGYHARYGVDDGVMSHSWSGCVRGLALGELEFGEVGLAALIAGAYGVPVGMVSGDDKLAAEAQALIPGVRCAVVKYALTRHSARCLSPARAREAIREAARLAVADPQAETVGVVLPCTATMWFSEPDMARWAARMPGVERADRCAVRTEVTSMAAFVDFVACAHALALHAR